MTDTAVNQQPVTGEQTTTETVATETQTTQTETVEQLLERNKNMESALRKANKEAETNRLALKKIEDEKLEKAKADMSELDRLKLEKEQADNKAKEAMAKANDRLIMAEVKAKALNFIDLDAAYALVAKNEITVDDNGNVQGVDEALAKLATDKPGLLKTKTNPSLNANNPGATNNAAPTDSQWKAFMNGGPLPS